MNVNINITINIKISIEISMLKYWRKKDFKMNSVLSKNITIIPKQFSIVNKNYK